MPRREDGGADESPPLVGALARTWNEYTRGLGDVHIGAVNAEVYSEIAQGPKRESPFKHTMTSTLTNGVAPTG